MTVDFHTHIFPDALAPKAIGALLKGSGNIYPPCGDGTAHGLLKNMDDWGVDISVIQPVITKQAQTKNTNEWAAGLSSGRLIPFGGIYPHTDDYKRDVDFVAGLGLKGLKFHPEYQSFTLDDARMMNIYDYALGKGLILLFHAGFDPAFAPPFRSSPKRFANIAKAMRGGTIVAAHLGGHGQWDGVEEHLVGTGVYLDTSMGFAYFPRDQFLRILKSHGADKLLFGSDSPWSNAGDEIGILKSLPLSKEDIDAVLSGNAKRILGL